VPTYNFQPGSARDLVKTGTWLRDAQGRFVLLRGVNLGSRSKLPPYLPIMPLGTRRLDAAGITAFRQELVAVQPQLDRLRQLGFNVVRLLVMWKGIEPTPAPDPARLLPAGEQYLGLVREIIDVLWARGLYVLIDFHQDLVHEVCSGDGFPDWALAIDAQHPRPSPPADLRDHKWQQRYCDSELVRHTLKSFWADNLTNTEAGLTNFQVRTHYEKSIGAAARFFQATGGGVGHPAILGYEPFNEPVQANIDRREFEGQILPDHYAKVAREIRSASAGGSPGDSRAFLFFEPRVDWSIYWPDAPDCIPWWIALANPIFLTQEPQTFLDLSDIHDDRMVFSFHYYDPWTFGYHLGPGWADDMANKQGQWPELFRRLRAAATERNLVPFLSEFGGSQDWPYTTDLRPDVYRTQIRAYMDLQYQQVEAHLLNATYWNYDLYNTVDGKDNWNLENLSVLGPNRTLRHPDILARPYPMRSSAEPQLVFFDVGNKHFAVILRGPVVDHPTVVYLPQATHYPNGFDVRATGPRVEWDFARQLLYWWPDPGLQRNQLVLCPCGRFIAAALPETWRIVLAATPVKSDPPECAQIRAEIAPLRARIRELEQQKDGLNPRDPVDMMEIRQINAQIDAVNAQIGQLQQRARTANCFCW
jgi:Cellulase (glycosyl hydrolase family 5)/Glycoside hydrolase family 5 C-terminal domain